MAQEQHMYSPQPGDSLATVPTLSQRYSDLVSAAAELQVQLLKPETPFTEEQTQRLLPAFEESIGAALNRLNPRDGRWHAVFPDIRFGIGEDRHSDATIRRASQASEIPINYLGLPLETHISIDTQEESVILDETGKPPSIYFRRERPEPEALAF